MIAFRHICALFRLRVAVFTASASLTGYVLASSRGNRNGWLAFCGVLLLTCGASALNQWQERDIDGRMERTRQRPLPAGVMTPRSALALSALLLLAGTGVLAACGPLPSLLGIAAVLWYNGLYTPLKRKTAFAAVYGAPAGMLPPAIGWTAGHAGLFDHRLLVLSLLFFLWQVPHFWMLALGNSADYERAGLPSPTTLFTPRQASRIAAGWMIATASAGLLLPLYGVIRSAAGSYALLPTAALLVICAARTTWTGPRNPLSAFRAINIYAGAMMLLISADALFAVRP